MMTCREISVIGNDVDGFIGKGFGYQLRGALFDKMK